MPRLAPPSPAAAVVAPGAAAGRAGRAVRRRGARAAVGRGAPRAAAVGAARGRNPEGVSPDALTRSGRGEKTAVPVQVRVARVRGSAAVCRRRCSSNS